MRLICPNCGAQYEVPVDVIPTGGRDVQCSNCGHTWFQAHPDDDTDLAEELNQPVPDSDWEPEQDSAPETPTVPPRQHPDDAAPVAVASAPDTLPDASSQPVRQRKLDPDVADVLREEREHEARIRAEEAGALESQPDLGLTAPDEDEQARRARQARDRMARMRGEDNDGARAAAEAAAAAAAGSRRELLPDVEEINQTLRSANEPRVVDQVDRREPPENRREGGGFARGFFLIVLLVAAAVAIYVSAPQISAAVPQAAPALESYVTTVDNGRIWLDEQVTALMMRLDQMTTEVVPDADTGAADSN